MKSLRTLVVGTLLGAAAMASAAAEERIEILTVTARPARSTVLVVEKVAPTVTFEISVPMPTDMPEAAIDYHLQPIGAVPAAERTKS